MCVVFGRRRFGNVNDFPKRSLSSSHVLTGPRTVQLGPCERAVADPAAGPEGLPDDALHPFCPAAELLNLFAGRVNKVLLLLQSGFCIDQKQWKCGSDGKKKPKKQHCFLEGKWS